MDLPLGSVSLGYKWIYKRKIKADGLVDKNKARLFDPRSEFLFTSIQVVKQYTISKFKYCPTRSSAKMNIRI